MALNIFNKSHDLCETYENKYGRYIDLVAESMKEKYRYEWTDNDTLAFGKYADTWESFRPVFEGDATSRTALGVPLATNMGMVAMSYAALPIQNFASIQPIEDEVGVIYFRSAVATQERGGLSVGDQLMGPYGDMSANIGAYVSETQTKSITISDVQTATYSGNIGGGAELRKGDLRVSVGGGKIKGMDDGEGHILGVNIDPSTSTIDYKTGDFDITFVNLNTLATNGDMIDVTCSLSSVESNKIPGMKWTLLTKPVRVEYDILQSQYTSISEKILEKKFGNSMTTMIAADLVTQIQASVLYRSIEKLRNSAIRNETKLGNPIKWTSTPPEGVSMSDHRHTFTDVFRQATDDMYKLAGVGDVTTIITGYKGLQILDTIGMETIRTAVSGPHLAGMFQNIPVYYAPRSVLGDSEVLCIYRGANWYEAPLVYAPYLPVTLIQGQSVGNVLTSAQGIYHASALDSVQDGFCVRVTIE